jgi:hypothetical protein
MNMNRAMAAQADSPNCFRSPATPSAAGYMRIKPIDKKHILLYTVLNNTSSDESFFMLEES